MILSNSHFVCNSPLRLENEPVLREIAACAFLAEMSLVWSNVKPHGFFTTSFYNNKDGFSNYLDNMMYLQKCVATHDFCQMCDRLECLFLDIVFATQKNWYYSIQQVLKGCERKNAEFIPLNAQILAGGHYENLE